MGSVPDRPSVLHLSLLQVCAVSLFSAAIPSHQQIRMLQQSRASRCRQSRLPGVAAEATSTHTLSRSHALTPAKARSRKTAHAKFMLESEDELWFGPDPNT